VIFPPSLLPSLKSDNNKTTVASENKNSSSAGLIIAILVALPLAGGLALFWKANQDLKVTIEERATELSSLKTAHADTVAKLKTEAVTQAENFRQEIEQINEEWNRQAEAEREKQQAKLTRIYEEVSKIVYNSEETLTYIDTVEAKLKEGQALSDSDVEQLEMLSAGLTYVKKQYSKPIHEFKELDAFLASQLGATAVPPKERYGLFRRIFGRKYKEAVRDYYKDEGRREAYTVAREKVSEAYASAQGAMAGLAAETDKYIKGIDALVAGNKAQSEDLANFFKSSRKIIDIHQSIMRLQEEQKSDPGAALEEPPKS